MTRDEWEGSADPAAMLRFLADRRGFEGQPPYSRNAAERGLGRERADLLACGWWRLVPPHDRDQERVVRGIESTGTYEDGRTGEVWDARGLLGECLGFKGAMLALGAGLVRCVAGDPFAAPAVLGGLRGGEASRLAGVAWRERRPDGTLDPEVLLALSDALEESGHQPTAGRTRSQVLAARSTVYGCCSEHADNKACGCLYEATPDGVLEHLRGPGPHIRGCHAVAMILPEEVNRDLR